MKLEGWDVTANFPQLDLINLFNPQTNSPVVMTGYVIRGAPVRVSRRPQQSIKPTVRFSWAWSPVWQHGSHAHEAGCDPCPKSGSSVIEKTAGERCTISHRTQHIVRVPHGLWSEDEILEFVFLPMGLELTRWQKSICKQLLWHPPLLEVQYRFLSGLWKHEPADCLLSWRRLGCYYI